jgi:uncharacterized protein YbjT (DUF2867 family)
LAGSGCSAIDDDEQKKCFVAGKQGICFNKETVGMYVIAGASGHTGGVAAEKLLESGAKVRVIGRDTGRLERLVRKGAEAFAADVADADSLASALQGATGAYLMIPPDVTALDIAAFQDRVSDAIARAVEKAGLRKAVVLSSIGADKPAKTGPVAGLHRLEEKLNGVSGLDAVYLRAGYFMENMMSQVGVIQNFGVVGGPLRGDLALPMIATRDIGAAVAGLLAGPEFSGRQARELLGQREVSYDEIAGIIGRAIGKPELKYQQLPNEQLRPALLQMGMSASMADGLLEMSASLNSGYMVALEKRSAENTTPTTVETFVAEQIAPRLVA